MAKAYYLEFKRQMQDLPEAKRLRVATIFSYAPNEDVEDANGMLGEENSDDTSQLISDDDGSVDRNGSGRGLGDGHQIQHFVFSDPMVFIHEFLLHQRHDDEPAAESEGADEEHGRKERPKTVRFGFLRHQGGQLLF